MIDLNYLLRRVPEFYELTQTDQIKYLAFAFVKNSGQLEFQVSDVRNVFHEFNLVVPTNFKRAFNKLLIGRIPTLVKRGQSYVFHPKADTEITLDIFGSNPSVDDSSDTIDRQSGIALFSKYDLHPDIKRVSFSQFQDGYYKEAIQNAFVEVVDQVKKKSGHPKISKQNGKEYDLDGDELMQRVFGVDTQTGPIVKFNDLTNSLEKAEQRGIMYLFKGVVGIRDKKAHLNYVQNDPIKTMEYLSLASLLMRLLDENT